MRKKKSYLNYLLYDWNNYLYNGFVVHADSIPPNKVWNDNCSDKNWEQLMNVSLSDLSHYKEEEEFVQYLINHCNKQENFLSFIFHQM